MRWVIFIFLITISCIRSRQAQIEKSIPEKDHIVFLNIELKDNKENDKSDAKLISCQISSGRFKPERTQLIDSSSYLCIEFYKRNKLISKFTIKHPLRETIEYEHDSLLKSKEIELDSTVFFKRFQLHQEPESIQLIEKLMGKEVVILRRIKLK